MITNNPYLSVVIPIHDMKDGEFFLWRTISALMTQSFQDFEIVITKKGKMAENTNAGIKKAKGELIKILYLDDYLAHPDSLKRIVDSFDRNDTWLVSGCWHQVKNEERMSPHNPMYTKEIATGLNTIGSPSVLTIRRDTALLFDENLNWMLDCDLYTRYYSIYGEPKILNDLNVVIGIGDHQTTYILSDEEKLKEQNYLLNKLP